MIKISIIGAGNVGINLFETLRKKKEVKIVSLFNRSLKRILSYKDKIFITNNIEK
jgi:Semialdehyde dehydrogenase, NAD binding domain.